MAKRSGPYFVYIVQCKDKTLYTGYTNDLAHRLEMHNTGQGAKYTRGRGPVKLVYKRKFRSLTRALQTEWKIKQLSRQERKELIKKEEL